MSYDLHIWGLEAWDGLVQQDLGIIIDPSVFRLGQFFLEGRDAEPAAADRRWGAIEADIGAVVRFFDLVVLHDQLPAFNYNDNYDARLDFGDGLGAVLNARGDKTLVHVNVELHMYRGVKEAALAQLQERAEQGPLVPEGLGREILSMLDATGYDWEPGLGSLQECLGEDPDQARLARFLLGELVFAGYAQLTGAPHVLAPQRSRLAAAVGLGAPSAEPSAEVEIYDELRRRFRDAGPGWRDTELPWTPSFLPFLLKPMNHYREGPDILLERAKELRDSPAIEKYRVLRRDVEGADPAESAAAREELAAAANDVARALDTPQQELELVHNFAVDVLPKAISAAVGASVAGPPGAVVGVAGEEALKQVQKRLWGWVLDRLPYRSARKLLARSAMAEHELRAALTPQLRTVWKTGRSSG